MAKYAIVKDGKVINLCEWDEVSNWLPPQGTSVVRAASDVSIGWNYTAADGFTFTPIPVVIQVPESCTPRQIRQALTKVGLRTQVEAAVAAGDQDIKDWWEFSLTVERTNPQVQAMASALGLSSAQVDDLWILADTL